MKTKKMQLESFYKEHPQSNFRQKNCFNVKKLKRKKMQQSVILCTILIAVFCLFFQPPNPLLMTRKVVYALGTNNTHQIKDLIAKKESYEALMGEERTRYIEGLELKIQSIRNQYGDDWYIKCTYQEEIQDDVIVVSAMIRNQTLLKVTLKKELNHYILSEVEYI